MLNLDNLEKPAQSSSVLADRLAWGGLTRLILMGLSLGACCWLASAAETKKS